MAGDGNTRKAKTTRVSQQRMPDYKNVLFLFKTDGVGDHLKLTWQIDPLCWTKERNGTFVKFCTQSRFQAAAAVG